MNIRSKAFSTKIDECFEIPHSFEGSIFELGLLFQKVRLILINPLYQRLVQFEGANSLSAPNRLEASHTGFEG